MMSFSAFCFAQVITDFESLYYLVQGLWPVHRFLHTYVGATLTALLTVFIGGPIINWFLKKSRPHFSEDTARLLEFEKPIPLVPLVAGAFLGTYSHVFFDSMMHADIQPLAPFSSDNGLLELVSLSTLHLICVVSGLIGSAIYFMRRLA